MRRVRPATITPDLQRSTRPARLCRPGRVTRTRPAATQGAIDRSFSTNPERDARPLRHPLQTFAARSRRSGSQIAPKKEKGSPAAQRASFASPADLFETPVRRNKLLPDQGLQFPPGNESKLSCRPHLDQAKPRFGRAQTVA